MLEEISREISTGLASGDLLSASQIDEQTSGFRARFGPAVLGELDGEALLKLMHGRESADDRSLAYWLEYKNDDDFKGNRFGKIGGGSALKFGLYQRKSDDAWITGSAHSQDVISLKDAIEVANIQKKELIAGAEVLALFDAGGMSDDDYRRLQEGMVAAAPNLAFSSWSHKYWFLLNTNKIDDYHSPRYQRFHLLKLLQMPPDEVGILDGRAPRFVCAGRFMKLADVLGAPVTALNTVLNRRHGAFHRYWKVGTTEGSDGGKSHWPAMRDGEFVSIGWYDDVPDLSTNLSPDKQVAKLQIRDWIAHNYKRIAQRRERPEKS